MRASVSRMAAWPTSRRAASASRRSASFACSRPMPTSPSTCSRSCSRSCASRRSSRRARCQRWTSRSAASSRATHCSTEIRSFVDAVRRGARPVRIGRGRPARARDRDAHRGACQPGCRGRHRSCLAGAAGRYTARQMKPTDTSNPDYYHKVVDCQWACPAHTDVPEYIRLIAQGRYSDAYIVNRESNVFPGILGRVCDRPCEPACRRGRVEEKPVAICRLKRVAADLRDDITPRLPKAPAQGNGKRIACIGAGPATLTVANDLLPLGYEVVIFEQFATAGGLMRTNIPAFRLAGAGARRGNRLHRGHGRRPPARHAGPQHARTARGRRLRRGVRRHRRTEGQGTEPPGSRGVRPHPHRHRVARVGRVRTHRCDRRARADHRRRQHGDGLLPDLVAARREKREGHGAQAPWLLQGVRMGTGGRGGRAGRDHRQPRPEVLRRRGRQAPGHEVRTARVRDGRRRHPQSAGGRGSLHSLRRRDPRDRPGKRLSVDRARPRHRVRQVGRAEARRASRSNRRARAFSSAATRRSGRRTSSGRSSTATRPRFRSTSTARASRSPRACRAASTCRAARSACTSGGTRTTTTPRCGG